MSQLPHLRRHHVRGGLRPIYSIDSATSRSLSIRAPRRVFFAPRSRVGLSEHFCHKQRRFLELHHPLIASAVEECYMPAVPQNTQTYRLSLEARKKSPIHVVQLSDFQLESWRL